MDVERLEWAGEGAPPLIEHFCYVDPMANAVRGGTGHFKAGQIMPASGFSKYPMREITFVIEGAIQTESGGRTVILKAGDMVSIPPNQSQISYFLEDTKLVYLFFGCENAV